MSNLRAFNLSGLSMSPFLKSSDQVLVECDFKEFVFGHCYLLKKNEQFFAHRYIGKNCFKGDRLIYLDEFEEIIGLVKYRIKDNSIFPINYSFLSKLMAHLSSFNLYRYRLLRFIPLFLIIFLGKVERLR